MVTTADGFNLAVHRITQAKKNTSCVTIIQHGLFSDSSTRVEKDAGYSSLPFQLSYAGNGKFSNIFELTFHSITCTKTEKIC